MKSITLKLTLFEKIFLFFEKYKSDKIEEYIAQYHSDIDSKFLNSNSTLNMLAFKFLSIDESDNCITSLIKHDEDTTPAFSCTKDNTGIDYILQGKHDGYYFCFRIKTKKYMRFFARAFENTFLENLAIDKNLSISTDKELIYLHGFLFNDYIKHHEKLISLMNTFNQKKQEQKG